jgi:hypothetical protein
MPPKKMAKGFISHRCDDYDSARWRKSFESFLRKLRIKPTYGCLLEDNITGILEKNIELAIKQSEIYIATVTPSWIETQKKDIGWPKKEWKLWNEIKEEPYKNFCIGLLIDTKRKDVGFISSVISFNLEEDYSRRKKPIPLFRSSNLKVRANPDDRIKIRSQLKNFTEEVFKFRKQNPK